MSGGTDPPPHLLSRFLHTSEFCSRQNHKRPATFEQEQSQKKKLEMYLSVHENLLCAIISCPNCQLQLTRTKYSGTFQKQYSVEIECRWIVTEQ